MQISCHTVDDFISNISEDVRLFDNTIWSSITKNPIDGNRKNASQFDVHFQADTVICFPDGGQCLLSLGIDCGKDYHDASQEFIGSEEADEYKRQLKTFCDGRCLLLRPGIVSM